MAGAFDLWDSGQVESSQSFDIRYRGKPLTSRSRCYWQAEVWDDQGAHARSAIASWEMGLLREADWSSAWIGAETAIMRDDRLAGLPWLGGSNDAQASGAGRSYRLPIDLPQPAKLTIFLNANRQPEAFMDGNPVPLPPRDQDAFGPPPPYKVTMSAPQGRHLLALFVPARPGAKPPRSAMLVRAELPSGETIRIDGTRARTVAGRPVRWNEPGLDDRDWEAVRAADGEGAAFPGEGAFLLRRAFNATGSVRSARLYMVALGSYVPMLNGCRVGDRQVTPEWTDFRRHVLYRAYDVTDQVKPSANVLGAIVGDGWYGSYLAPAGRFGFGGAPLRWQRFGDTAVIDEHWEAMDRFLESIRAPNPDLLWKNRRGNDYGDWLSLDGKEPGDPTTPKDLVGTAMWKAAADAMADMAAVTGRGNEKRRYRELSGAIGRAFNRAYVRPDGTVGNGSQTGYILALHFNLLPDELREPAAEKLVSDIERRGKLLSTGFLGTPYSLDVLAEAGRDSLVYDLLLRTAYPSWGYMIARNATTIWERRNGDVGSRVMNSFNHYALGAVAGFMFRRIAGINPTEPGFSRFEFNPIFDARMRKAGGRYESQAGLIATAWEWRSDQDFALDISVPANARCALHLPTRSIDNVREGGRQIGRRSGFKPIAHDNRLVLEIGSGDYAFTLKPTGV